MYNCFALTPSLEDLRKLVEKHQAPEIEPYAYIRFSNEGITLQACLDSIQPYFKKGILCYHDPLPGITPDNSLAIAQQFVAANPSFRLVRYPFPVIFHNMPRFKETFFSGATSKLWLLHAFSMFAHKHLEILARENGDLDKAWVYKVDCDHIFSPKLLEYTTLMMRLKAADGYSAAYFYKANITRDYCNYQDGKQPPLMLTSIVNVYDHCICKLTEIAGYNLRILFRKNEQGKKELVQVYELQSFKPSCKVAKDFVPMNSWHFYYEKLFHYQNLPNAEVAKALVRSTRYDRLDPQLFENFPEVHIDPEFYSLDYLNNLVQKFNYPSHLEAASCYGRANIDVDTLYNDPQYRPDDFIADHNTRYARRHELNAQELAELEREHEALAFIANDANLIMDELTLNS